MLKALMYLQWIRNNVDPCLYYKWIGLKTIIFLLWTDDFLIVSKEQHVVIDQTKKFRSLFDTTDEGEMTDYLGCLVKRNSRQIQLTQPVKIRKLQDEFEFNGS